jgi:hypothetical protein
MKYFHTIGIAVILAALSGCGLAALSGCGSTPAARPKREPGAIALRNSTGGTLKKVRIGEDRDSTGSSRLGQLSPVLPDVTYPFVRAANARALPARVQVQWTDASNHERSATVELGDLLKQAGDGGGQALLFEIGPAGTVDARIVPVPR